MSSRFSILAAVRNGYTFVGREAGYLGRLAVLPLGVLLITNLTAYYNGVTPSPYMDFLINLPARILQGWFMFILVRLLLLGERAPVMTQDISLLQERHRGLKACILLWLVYNAWVAGFVGYSQWFLEQGPQPGGLYILLALLLLGVNIWALRLGVAHILGAVGYPLRDYIYRVNGIGISLRLTGLLIVCSSPLMIVLEGIGALLVPAGEKPSESTSYILLTLACVLWMALVALLSASASYALKEILGRIERPKAA
jgi:hypothetical protein